LGVRQHTKILMLIFAFLIMVGIVGSVVGLAYVCHGLLVGNIRCVLWAVLVPVMYWGMLFVLAEVDRRYIEREIQKNHGRIPEWVW
jgi:hypothetical protein